MDHYDNSTAHDVSDTVLWGMPISFQSTPVKSAKAIWAKKGVPTKEVALFVTHAPQNLVKPHVPLYLSALRDVGIHTIVIVATDAPDRFDPTQISEQCDQLIIRENVGFDFAAWAHSASLVDFSGCKIVYLLNDSIVGPTSQTDFEHVIRRIRESDAEFISATRNGDTVEHAQSYFLVWKDKGVPAMQGFLSRVQNEANKYHVIIRYELNTLSFANSRGLTYHCLFDFPTAFHTNPTIYHWQELLALGFPFIKAETMRRLEEEELPREVIENAALSSSWRFLLSQYGKVALPPEIILYLADGRRINTYHKRAQPLKYYLYKTISEFLKPFSTSKSERFHARALKYYPKKFLTPLYVNFPQTFNVGAK